MQSMSQKEFMAGFNLLKADLQRLSPLVLDDVARTIELVEEEIKQWKAGEVEKPSWGFFSRLFEDKLDTVEWPSPWEKPI
jgi:hypothetical protein